MKSEKGMTIVALLVYIIVLTIVIGTISMLMKYFYKNENETAIQKNTSEQYSRFIAYITDDINSGKIESVEKLSNSDICLNFVDGSKHEYRLDNNKIYNIVESSEHEIQKKIELCSKVQTCIFDYDAENNKITTTVTVGNLTYKNNFTVK